MQRLALLVAFSMFSTSAIADDLQYNPNVARQTATFQNLDMRTRGCMNEGVRSMLQLGSRDRAQITSFAVQSCGGPLYNYMTHDLGRPAQEVSAYLNAMANDELNHVPGIAPKPAAPQFPDPHTSPGDHNAYYCRSLRLDYPYTRTCPEPWVTVDAAEQAGAYNPIISCGSGGCFPMDNTDASRAAAAKANADNARLAMTTTTQTNDEAYQASLNELSQSWDHLKATLASTFEPWEIWVFKISAIIFGLAAYLFPAIKAKDRHHPNARTILALNLFLGWTVIGWVSALVWAYRGGSRPKRTHRDIESAAHE